jgi:hypothetical protein
LQHTAAHRDDRAPVEAPPTSTLPPALPVRFAQSPVVHPVNFEVSESPLVAPHNVRGGSSSRGNRRDRGSNRESREFADSNTMDYSQMEQQGAPSSRGGSISSRGGGISSRGRDTSSRGGASSRGGRRNDNVESNQTKQSNNSTRGASISFASEFDQGRISSSREGASSRDTRRNEESNGRSNRREEYNQNEQRDQPSSRGGSSSRGGRRNNRPQSEELSVAMGGQPMSTSEKIRARQAASSGDTLNNSFDSMSIDNSRGSRGGRGGRDRGGRGLVSTGGRERGGRQRPAFYEEYLGKAEIEQGLADGTLMKGVLRINKRNSQDSYVTCEGHPKGLDRLILTFRFLRFSTEIQESST